MSTRDSLLALLSQAAKDNSWVSGEEAASELGVSRAAIWKAVKALEEEGYLMEAQRNRGYRLAANQDVVTKPDIDTALADANHKVSTEYKATTGSTNIDVKQAAEQGRDEIFAIVAGNQQTGRGRRGRAFFSPAGKGIYLSILIRPNIAISEATSITAAAAVATSRAIDTVFGVTTSIKWVNDIYLGEKKICGILTEAASDLETGTLTYAVTGIGVNVYEPEGGYPEEIKNRAGSISQTVQQGKRAELAGAIIREFVNMYEEGAFVGYLDEYRGRSFILGREIMVIEGKSERKATALDICDDLSLHVQFEDGTQKNLQSGEVSLKVPC